MNFKSLWLQMDLFVKVVLLCGIGAVLFLIAPYFGISRHVAFSPDAAMHRGHLDEASTATGAAARAAKTQIQERSKPGQKVKNPARPDLDSKESKGLAELEELLK